MAFKFAGRQKDDLRWTWRRDTEHVGREADNFRKKNPKQMGIGIGAATRNYPIASGESWPLGALLRLNGSSQLTELTGTGQTVKGVAMESATSGASSGPNSTLASIVLLVDEQDTHPISGDNSDRDIPTDKSRFAVTDVNSTTPTSSHIGTAADIALSGGEWFIDVSGSSHVDIVDIDTVRGVFLVTFKDAKIQ